MEKSDDRISKLPDDILHSILSMMPMKFIIRTSILSRRWRNLWKPIWAYATALDLGAEFASGQTPEEFVATVNRYLQLHKGKEVRIFRLPHIPCNPLDAEKWVEFAVAKRVKKLDIDFCKPFKGSKLCKLPNSLFTCDSITHLKLSRCDFSPLLNFKGCPYLKTLHLSDVTVTDALFESMISNCPLMEELILKHCHDLTHIKVSPPDLPLKSLIVEFCWDVDEIEIFAPNLRSFCFSGDFIPMYFKNISSLVDVLLKGICMEDHYIGKDCITVLHHLEHVKILTLFSGSLEYVGLVEEYTPEDLPLRFHNLLELQLVLEWFGWSYLPSIYSFFENCLCPNLMMLFIYFPPIDDPSQSDYQSEELLAEDTPDIVFDNLKVTKMNGFTGLKDEMLLVKFFLENAIGLEHLVLAAPQKAVCDVAKDSALECKSDFASTRILHRNQLKLSESADTSLDRLCERLFILVKASSSDARILICDYSEVNDVLFPRHKYSDFHGLLIPRFT
ncbi:F-box protein At4g09920-like isoform X1 [Magnolia sinica]|uniref:F-box protein At4g09920-like isoform X1 n=1 Tax=Magnolia sinica TaxID=86752 RepID=UPI002658DD64|nr:F-box protein At4g09920-like isoform X1 [Magnolia sinica]XP_058073173.1 F-box protein At4g09920-like isoform X1 [Magnolia sinica]XP_058073174.1 F-box protein At4g09920-like isoform X1 [Magnolia sinica]